MTASRPRRNPYVGPRAFERGDTLYGRDRELRRLLNLLIAERIVLFYSPSGAGKTSLIQAALIPALEKEGFRVWPAMRVNRELPPAETAGTTANRYLLSLLLYLEEGLPPDAQTPIDDLTGMTLDAYLDRRSRAELESFDDVFIFDQFEEILTLDPTDRDVKLEFFEQLGDMLQDRRRWALFAMREEFIAGLDPYLRPIPTRFSATFRLELLSPDAARQAMQNPAQTAGVEFTDGAAGQLVDDLRTVRVLQSDGAMGERLGLYVEPVQLQVVCRHLWERLSPDAMQIVEADLEAVGDVDRALAEYYAGQVEAIAAGTGVSERTIREWIDRQLITEQGIRGQVLQEPEQSRGLDNQVIRRLVDVHLMRAEERRGATWFELAHDRLIEPVRGDNAAWRIARLSVLQRQAALWEDQGRPGGLLLRDEALTEAEAWATTHEAELTDAEWQFLRACQETQTAAEKERRQSRRIRWLAVGTTIFSVIAIALAIVAGLQTHSAVQARETARAAKSTSVRLVGVMLTLQAPVPESASMPLTPAQTPDRTPEPLVQTPTPTSGWWTNQDMLTAFHNVGVRLGLSDWGLLAQAGLDLAELERDSQGPYQGPDIDQLPNLTDEQKKLIKSELVLEATAQAVGTQLAQVTVNRARVGIVGRNAERFGEIDFQVIREAKIEAIVMMSYHPRELFERIKRENPDIEIITRLYDDRMNTHGHPTPKEFADRMIPIMQALGSYCTKFQVHHEPNHRDGIEGWGPTDEDAEDFNGWFLEVFDLLKAAHPWASLGFPGLAIPTFIHRDRAWLQICKPAIERADWLGVHCYWQTPPDRPSVIFDPQFGLTYKYYHQQYPDKPIEITEFANSNVWSNWHHSWAIPDDVVAQEYVKWLQEVFKYDYVNSASAFLLSSQDPQWAFFSWRTEHNHKKPVVHQVGSMDRPPLYEP
jgi:hypothetical protein